MEVAGSILGGLIASDGARSAASTQAAATREANQLLKEQADRTRQDLSPWRTTGQGALNALARRLGIGGDMPASVSEADLRAQLLPSFTRTTGNNSWTAATPDGISYGSVYEPGQTTVDEQGLAAAIQARMAQQAQAQREALAASDDPTFGSLLKPFTGQDLASEPGYQFGLSQGMNALDRRLQAGGQYFSGAALKAGQRYAQDYAGTKFNDAFNRDASNKRMTYDFLSGQSTMGQNAAAGQAAAGTAMAGQVGANTTALGNAVGASQIAGANAIGGAINNGIGGYQQNQLMDRILSGNRAWGGNSSGFGGGGLMDDLKSYGVF